ncbi:MAG: alpha/beta hydrolase family protein [Lachnospiraceae bacterium]|nr:alpha/beta hydrolase family protein [Lachnospiraceae bacterium]
MIGKNKKKMTYYDSLPGMLRYYDGVAEKDRFTGNTSDELNDWQVKSRKTLSEVIGLKRLLEAGSEGGILCSRLQTGHSEDSASDSVILSEAKNPPTVCEKVDSVSVEGGITREKYLFHVDEYTIMTMYVLRPACASKGTYLALAGHQGGGKESVAGVRDLKCVRERIDFFNYDYGLKLAKMGYLTICPDPRGFGERRDEVAQGDTDSKILNSSCRSLSNMAIPLGLSVVGLCVCDYVRLIDYLSVPDNVITGSAQESGKPVGHDNADRTDGDTATESVRVGIVGFSGGGMQALYLAALDERVKNVVISGYMYGVKDSLLILNNNCSCNFVPGLWDHFDMGDIACMIAPRPLIIQSCEEDHLNGPRGLENVYEQIKIIRRAYEIYGAGDDLKHDIRPGEHHFYDEVLENL